MTKKVCTVIRLKNPKKVIFQNLNLGCKEINMILIIKIYKINKTRKIIITLNHKVRSRMSKEIG